MRPHYFGASNTSDIPFSLKDLIPVKQKKSYTFTELAKLIDYSYYFSDTNWTNEDYLSLYSMPGHVGIDFFNIRDTGIIVTPALVFSRPC